MQAQPPDRGKEHEDSRRLFKAHDVARAADSIGMGSEYMELSAWLAQIKPKPALQPAVERFLNAFESDAAWILGPGRSGAETGEFLEARSHFTQGLEDLRRVGMADIRRPGMEFFPRLSNALELVRLRMPLTDETLQYPAQDMVHCSPEVTRRLFIQMKTLSLLGELNEQEVANLRLKADSESEIHILPVTSISLRELQGDTSYPHNMFHRIFSPSIRDDRVEAAEPLRLRPEPERLTQYLLETGFTRERLAAMEERMMYGAWYRRVRELYDEPAQTKSHKAPDVFQPGLPLAGDLTRGKADEHPVEDVPVKEQRLLGFAEDKEKKNKPR